MSKIQIILNKFNNKNKREAYRDMKLLIYKNESNIQFQRIFSKMAIALDDIDSAISSLKFIISKDKNDLGSLYQLYQLFIKQGKFDKALFYINIIININKKHFQANRDSAYLFFQKGEINNARKFVKIALEINNQDLLSLNISGLIDYKDGKFINAKNCFEKAIKINSDYIDSYNNLGACLLELEEIHKAFKKFKIAYKKNNKNILTLINIGNVLGLFDKLKASINFFKKALELSPNNSDILANIAICYCRERDFKNAKIYYDRAIKINPKDYKLKSAYSSLKINLNRFNDCWDLFDSRLLIEKNNKKLKSFHLVKDSLFNNLKIDYNKKLLVLREQGIGEEILFSSVYPDIIKNFKNVKFEVDKRLIGIFKRSFKKDIFFEEGHFSNSNKVKDFELVAYAGSLVRFFRKQESDFNYNNFLYVDGYQSNKFKADLLEYNSKVKIGISWKSNISNYGRLKSLSIDDFETFFNKDRIIINLQYGNITDELNYLKSKNMVMKHFKDLDIFNNIEGCFGLLYNLDLLITVSNSTAHFAGALGVPTIVICPKKSSTYYYWNVKNKSSIWYKNIKVVGIDDSVEKTMLDISNLIKKYDKSRYKNK